MGSNRRAVLSASGLAALAFAAPVRAANDSDTMKAAAETFVDRVLNNRDVSVIDSLVAENFEPQNADEAAGRDALKTRLGDDFSFDLYLTEGMTHGIETMATKGADLLLRGLITGERDGKKIEALYFMQFRFKDNLIATYWELRDESALMGI